MSANSSHSRPRTLVLCFDGTLNEYDGDNTNVVDLFSLLKKDRPDEQLCYYQAGIGTYFDTGTVSPLLLWAARLLDQAVAWYLPKHVQEGYKFIMQSYKPGDRICIFGFSRGAYTARALAGMCHKMGLLQKNNFEQIPFAYKLYKRTDEEGIKLAAGFKNTYCCDVSVEFMGVWDTISSNSSVHERELFRHALSLDERRAKFRPNLFHRPTPSDSDVGFVSGLARGPPEEPSSLEPSSSEGTCTDVLEVWFPGCHLDIGGGAVPNSEPHSLQKISLRWMISQIKSSQCGILFKDEMLSMLGILPAPLPNAKESWSVSGSTFSDNVPELNRDLDRQDAVAPLHDGLSTGGIWWIIWWILEFFPFPYSWQDRNDVWHTTYGPNWGRGREIEDEHPLFHKSVKQRMQDRDLKYKPTAKWEEGEEIYVD